jgi:hypothetical protein
MTDAYVIWSIEHQAWWRPGWMGYCVSLHDAGLYTQREAAEILSRANLVAFHEAMIPVTALGAAPELLQLVREALQHFTDDADPENDSPHLIDLRGWLKAATLAIAKAEGR